LLQIHALCTEVSFFVLKKYYLLLNSLVCMNLTNLIQKFSPRSWLHKSSYFWESKTLQEEWPKPQPSGTAFALTRWPQINAKMKNANNYRALSLLSHGPVSFDNLKRCMRGSATDTVFLLQYLDRQGALEIVHTEWAASHQSLKQVLGDQWLH
jgi:hypothetical protein